MLSPYTRTTNFVLLTLDSCRWDTFCASATPTLRRLGSFRKAAAQVTYTYPSHMSMFAGILPDVREPIPYYNRFEKNLFRIAGRKVRANAYVEFPVGTRNVVAGLRSWGYRTFGCGAMEWFTHPDLTFSFDDFLFTGIHLTRQIDFIASKILSSDGPFFAFVNIGETHEPYRYGGHVEPSLQSRARMRSFVDEGFIQDDFERQIAAMEYVDRELDRLLACIATARGSTIVIVCADHGECFGEDGCYGHGFYHQKVMEVPLGIFEL